MRKRKFVNWIARFEVASKKVMEAWVGLLDLSAVPRPDDFNFTDILSQQQYTLLQGTQDPQERRETAKRMRTEHVDAMKQAHRETFPLSDNLMSLFSSFSPTWMSNREKGLWPACLCAK